MDNSVTQLRSVTRHSVTCYPTQVNTPRLNPNHTGRYSIYLHRRDGRLSWPIGDLLHTLTHPSTNRPQCWLTSLLKPTPLTTTLRRHVYF